MANDKYIDKLEDMDNEELAMILAEKEREAHEGLKNDVGHATLLKDLAELYEEAKDCEFHDFLNGKYATPKRELHRKLSVIIEKIERGVYDNV